MKPPFAALPTRATKTSMIRARLALASLTVLVAWVAACGGRVAGGTPAVFETCGISPGDPAELTPHFECIANDDGGHRHAIFSYSSSASGTISTPIGPNNLVYPTPSGRGQPTTFRPGSHVGAFSVDMPESSLAWVLGSKSATAVTSGRECVVEGGLAEVFPGSGVQVDVHQVDANELTGSIVRSATQGFAAGHPSGTFVLGSDGSGHYSLPLWVPEGRAGIQPHLALTYSSNAGNGQLGVGFGLSGLSEITRCAHTKIDDGIGLSVNFNDSKEGGDKLCLDGDGLAVASADSFHVTEYRTRHETYSQILVDGYDEQGPTSFTVRTKDGSILRYGTRPESRLESLQVAVAGSDVSVKVRNPAYNPLYPGEPGNPEFLKDEVNRSSIDVSYSRPVRLSWALTEVSDRVGNTMTLDYEIRSSIHEECGTPSASCAAAGVEQLPIRISYTALPNKPATREVRFTWQSRNDVRERWITGMKLASAHVLQRIEMWAPDPETTRLLRSYSLSYEPSPETKLARLMAVQECDRLNACREPIVFGWFGASVAREEVELPGVDVLDYPGLHPAAEWPKVDRRDPLANDEQFDPGGELLVLDINGDGFDDILYRTRHDPVLDVPSPPPTSPQSPPKAREIWFWYRLSNGTSFEPPQPAGIGYVANAFDFCEASIPPMPPADFEIAFNQKCLPMPKPIDVDLDGRPELHDGYYLYKWDQSVAQYVATGGFRDVATDPSREAVYVADLDGDSFPELLKIETAKPLRFFENNGGVLNPTIVTGPGDASSPGLLLIKDKTFVGDWDGEGRFGLLRRSFTSSRYGKTSTSRGISGWVYNVTLGGLELTVSKGDSTGVSYVFADLNGDGLVDAVERPNSAFAPPAPASMNDYHVNTGVGFLAPVAIDTVGKTRFPLDDAQKFVTDTHLRVTDENRDGQLELRGLDGAGVPLAGVDPKTVLAPTPYSPLALLDMNGDGIADVIAQPDPTKNLVLYRSQPAEPDHLGFVREAGDLHVSYRLRPPERTTTGCVAGQTYCLTRGMWVVATVARTSRNATPGAANVVASAEVDWASPLSGLAGRGFLGFASRSVRNLVTGEVVTTSFDNASPNAILFGYRGTILGETRTSPIDATKTIVETDSYRYELATGTLKPLSVDPFAPTVLHLRSIEHRMDEVAGKRTPLRWITAALAYDVWGNTTSQTSFSHLTSTRRHVETKFRNDSINWLLGLAERTDADAMSPGETLRRSVSAEFDGLGRITRRILAPDAGPEARLVFAFYYNAAGLLADTYELDGTGDVRLISSTSYDDAESMFPSTVTNGLGHVRRYLYHHGLGLPVMETDVNGVSVHRKFDGFGRLRAVLAPDGSSFAQEYIAQPSGATDLYAVDSFGRTSTTRYDDVSRLVEQHDAGFSDKGRLTEYQYTDLVHPQSPTGVSRPRFVGDAAIFERFAYDALGRPLSTTHADGAKAQWTYSGRQVHAFDEVGNETVTERDELGRVVSRTQYPRPTHLSPGGKPVRDAVVTRYVYSPFDELRETIDPDGHVIVNVYDVRGRPVRSSDPDAGERVVRLDAFGDVLEAFDGAGARTEYAVDPLGRVLGLENKDGIQCYRWDTAPHGIGKLAGADAGEVKKEYSYDVLGRVTSEATSVGGETFVSGTEFDSKGLVSAITYPAVGGFPAPRVAFAYDASGRLESATFVDPATGASVPADPLAGAALWKIAHRDAGGNVVDRALGNGLRTVQTIDPVRGFVKSIETGIGPAAGTLHDKVQWATFGYGPDGEIMSRADRVAGYAEQLQYDGVHELTDWKAGPASPTGDLSAATAHTTYAYDSLGNLVERVEQKGSAPPRDEVFDIGAGSAGPHAVTSTSFSGGPLLYDANGDQTKTPQRTVVYTAADLPKEITTATGTTTFKYDAFATRVKKEDDAGSITTVGGYERRVTPDGTTHAFFLPGAVMVVWNERDGRVIGKKALFLHEDHLGSPQVITDEKGAVVERRRFEPFGRQVKIDDPLTIAPTTSPVRDGFTGQEADEELQLVNMRGRIYDPQNARFLTPDPLVSSGSAVGYNRYAYVANDPLRFSDPSGFDGICDISGGCGTGSLDTGPAGGSSSSGEPNYDPGPRQMPGPSGPYVPPALPTFKLPTIGAAYAWPGLSVGDNSSNWANGNNNKVDFTPFHEGVPTAKTPAAVPAPPPPRVDAEYEHSWERWWIVNGNELAIDTLKATGITLSAIATFGVAEAIWGSAAVGTALGGGGAAVGAGAAAGGEGLGIGAGVGAAGAAGGAGTAIAEEGPAVESEITSLSEEARTFARETPKLYDIVKAWVKAPGFEKHHGVLDAWAKANIPGYSSGTAPAITLLREEHDATRAVFNVWRAEMGWGRGAIPWQTISPQAIQALSYRMFAAAGVPGDAANRYFTAFSSYLYSGQF